MSTKMYIYDWVKLQISIYFFVFFLAVIHQKCYSSVSTGQCNQGKAMYEELYSFRLQLPCFKNMIFECINKSS